MISALSNGNFTRKSGSLRLIVRNFCSIASVILSVPWNCLFVSVLFINNH